MWEERWAVFGKAAAVVATDAAAETVAVVAAAAAVGIVADTVAEIVAVAGIAVAAAAAGAVAAEAVAVEVAAAAAAGVLLPVQQPGQGEQGQARQEKKEKKELPRPNWKEIRVCSQTRQTTKIAVRATDQFAWGDSQQSLDPSDHRLTEVVLALPNSQNLNRRMAVAKGLHDILLHT